MTDIEYLMQTRNARKRVDVLLESFLDLNDQLNKRLSRRKIMNILGTEDLNAWSRDVLKLNDAIKGIRAEIQALDTDLESAWERIGTIQDEDVRHFVEDFFYYGKCSGEISELEGCSSIEVLRMLEKGMMLIESSVSDKESDE
ncbi:MAG: hypothetical protein IJJ67_03395 [Oscillospiraceae bacterium]|nr:hypothetical protein [Oscillospiraceae bacterium]